jgi:hypothetical protein
MLLVPLAPFCKKRLGKSALTKDNEENEDLGRQAKKANRETVGHPLRFLGCLLLNCPEKNFKQKITKKTKICGGAN